MFPTLLIAGAITAAPCTTVRDIDVKHLAYPLRDPVFTDGQERVITVANGAYEAPHRIGEMSFFYFRIGSVAFGEMTSDGGDRAAVIVGYGSTTGNYHLTATYVLGCHDGAATVDGVLMEERVRRDTGLKRFANGGWEAQLEPIAIRNGFLEVSCDGIHARYRLEGGEWRFLTSNF